jgi:hypothetical protein
MGELISGNFGKISNVFADEDDDNAITAGIKTGFPILGFKGKTWSIRYRGEVFPLMRDDGDGPRGSVDVVILKSSEHVAKFWYERGYEEGSVEAPDCFSTNGLTPDPSSKKAQSKTCALCPKNQFGSRITPSGKKGKACSDTKRIAVTPVGDLHNETYGGPMLLRVPAASLNDMAMYAQMAKNAGFKTFAIATKISFDADQAYPKLKFSAIRPLKDDEAQVVLDLRNSPQIDRILQEEISSDEPVTTEAATSFFSEPPVEVAPKVEAPKPFPKVEATKPKVAAPKKAAPPPPVVEQVVEKVIETVQIEDDITFDDDLDAQLDALLPKR